MDLPTCPACNQSVLDEDAEICPFCGASMSGKPASGGAPKPAAAAPKPAAKSIPSEEKPAEDDSVIQSDKSAAKAIPVRRKRVKGLVLRVRCPMCETEGWVPAKAAGRNVRCANKECLVPVFPAPALPKKAEPEPEQTSSGISWPIVGIVALSLVVVGVGFATEWRFFLVPKIETPTGPTIFPTAGGSGSETDPDNDNGRGQPLPPVPAAKSVAEVRTEVLEKMTRLSRDTPLRYKPRARGVVVSAHGRAGDLEGAAAELKQLEDMSDVAPIDYVDPLIELAWAELAAGESESANRRAERALGFAEENRLPGRTVGQAVGNLAALLFVLDRPADAESVIAFDPNAAVDRALALAEIRARASGSFDVDLEYGLGTMLPHPNHSQLMVVAQLADHGQWKAALEFARTRTSPGEKAECLVLLADLVASRPPGGSSELPLDDVLSALDADERRLAEARVAARRLVNGVEDSADWAILEGNRKPAGAAAALPAPQAILAVSHGFADRRPTSVLALAAAGRALAIRAETKSDELDKAWVAYVEALEHAAAYAPPLEQVSAHRALASRGTIDGIPPAQMTDYRARVDQLEAIARAGFEIKVAVLLDAATNGLADEVWARVNGEAFEESTAEILGTPLGLVLQRNGSAETKEAVAAAVESVGAKPSLKEAAVIEPDLLLVDEATPTSVAKTISEARGPEADTVALRVACRLRRGPQGRSRSVQFVKALQSRFVAAEAAMFVEAASAKGLAADRLWVELDQDTGFADVVAVRACEGLLLALESSAKEPVPAVATGEK